MHRDLTAVFKRDHDVDITDLFDMTPYLKKEKELLHEKLMDVFMESFPNQGMVYEVGDENYLRNTYNKVIREDERPTQVFTLVAQEKGVLISVVYGVTVQKDTGESENIFLEGGIHKAIAEKYLIRMDIKDEMDRIRYIGFSN